jgi:alanyl-tRNA synthetase
MLKVMHLQNYKGGVRISILCGTRALLAFREKEDIIGRLMQQLSASADDLLSRVQQLQQEKQELLFALGEVRQKLAWKKLQEQVQARKSDPQAVTTPDKDIFLLFEDALEPKDMRLVINRFLKENGGTCGIFAGSAAEGYHYIIGSEVLDCRQIGDVLKTNLNAKGGGTPQMIQGSVTASQEAIVAMVTKMSTTFSIASTVICS